MVSLQLLHKLRELKRKRGGIENIEQAHTKEKHIAKTQREKRKRRETWTKIGSNIK